MANSGNTPGVGLLFNPALAEYIRTHGKYLDHLSVIPDRFWLDRGAGMQPRFEDLPAGSTLLDEVAGHLPVNLHCIGMSICSASNFDEGYVEQAVRWRNRYRCPWISDHLSFTRTGAGHETNAAVALPIPYDLEVLRLLEARVQIVQSALGCPFLLENNVYYFNFPDQELTESQFLNQLTQLTSCHLLLDLHNVYTNSRNHGFSAVEFLAELDLSRVLEIHIAGGTEMMGFYTDSHSGPVHDDVWDLLAFVAPRATSLRGVTFEFHESAWPLLRDAGVTQQIERARSILAGVPA